MSLSIKHIYTYDDKLVDYIDYIVDNKAEGQISKQMLEENKARQIFRKTNVSYSLRTHVCVSGGSGRKKCSFYGKFGLLCFLLTPVLRFALLPY